MILGRRALLVFSVVSSLGVGCAAEENTDDDVGEDTGAIVGENIANNERPEVVQLRISPTDGKPAWLCTGTLVGKRTIVTARHCVSGAIQDGGKCAGTASIDTLGRGAAAGTKVAFERCATADLGAISYWKNDFAFIRLAAQVAGVTPATLATTRPPRGTFTAYGYGGHGAALGYKCESLSDGNKRKTTYTGTASWHIPQTTCPGDSGGPHFVGTSNVIAAVTSGGALGIDANATAYSYPTELAAQLRAFEQ